MERESGWVAAGALIALLLLGLLFWPDAHTRDELAAPGASASSGRGGPAPLDGLGDAHDEAQAEPLVDATPEPAAPAAPAPAQADPSDAAALRALQVSGRIVDLRGFPVADALVRLHTSSKARERLGLSTSYFMDDVPWDAFPGTRSDAEGRFELEVQELADDQGRRRTWGESFQSGTALVVTHPGFRPRARRLPGESWSVELGDVELEPGVVVSGRVVDEAGTPLEGALLQVPRMGRQNLFGADDEWGLLRELMSARSGADGHFRVDTQWPGKYRLEARLARYQPWSDDVVFQPGAPLELGDIVLAPGHVIAGRVVDERGQPLVGATVKARPQALADTWAGEDTALRDLKIIIRSGQGPQEQQTVSDAEGRFVFDDLPETSFDLLASHPRREPVALRGQAVDASVEIVLLPEALIALTLLDDVTGEPIVGARANVRRCSSRDDAEASMDPYLEVLTGREAAERLGRDDAGDGLVVGGPAGFLRHVVKTSAGARAPLEVELPGLAPGEVLERTLRIRPGARLGGRTLDGQGQPVAGVRLRAVQQHDELPEYEWPSVSADSDEQGAYGLEGLTAGSWSLSASRRGWVEPPARSLELAEAQVLEGVDVTLQPGARIAGLLLDAEGLPAAAQRVNARTLVADEAAAHAEQVSTDTDGRFAIEGLPAGSIELSAHPGGLATLTSSYAEVSQVTLQLRRPARVTGRVLDGDGRPLEAEVECYVGQLRWPDHETQTDAQGEYAFEELLPGEHVFVARSGGLRGLPVVRELAWDEALVVDLRFADGRIVGTLTEGVGGAPLPGVSVLVRGPPRTRDEQRPGSGRVDALSDEQGRFEVARLTPGEWRVLVGDSDYVPVDPEPLLVTVGEGVSACSLAVVRCAVLAGHVSAVGELSGTLSIQLESLDGQGGRSAALPSQGPYQVKGLRTGRYRYTVKRTQRFPALPDQEHVFASGEVELLEGQTSLHDIVLLPMDG